jgi:hypothetical protein
MKKSFTITGVFADQPKNNTLQFEWLAPFNIMAEKK